jgi:integrase
MPKKAKELSAIQVRKLTKPGLHAVGGVAGLLLQVTPSGARSWILRATVGNRRRDIGLGGFPDVDLAYARDRARETRELIRQGIDPVEHKKAMKAELIASQAKARTFAECARLYLAKKGHEFKNGKHAAQWRTTLETYAYPVIGRLPVDKVELAHIVQILEPIWTTKTETAARLRGRIESVLAYATVSGYRSGDNPARWRGNLDAVLAKPSKVKKVQHHRAIPWQEVGAFMVDLRQREGVAARALEFLILTATRSGEVRGATWEEFDLDSKTWTVPAERMKAGKTHTIPLCADAVRLLKALPRLDDSPYIFPAPRGGQLSDMALSAVMRRMSVDATPHGFRSTFRDWCAESTNYAHDVAEMALAHTIPDKVVAAYRRGDLLQKRTSLMRDWCRYLNAIAKAGAIPIRGRA